MEGTAALFELVCRRAWVLEELRDGGATVAALAATVDASRPTVRRSVEDLAEAGLVERDGADDRYALTLTGRLVLDRFRRSVDRLAGVDHAAPWLASLPSSTPLAPAALEAATVHDGAAARSRLASLVEEASALSGWLPSRRPGQASPVLSRPGPALDLVVPSVLARRLLSDCGQAFVDWLARESVTVREADDLPPYGLLVATVDGRRRVCLGFHEAGTLDAMAETGRDDAVEWAADRVAARRAAATPLEPP